MEIELMTDRQLLLLFHRFYGLTRLSNRLCRYVIAKQENGFYNDKYEKILQQSIIVAKEIQKRKLMES